MIFTIADPFINAALAAERRGRFLAEAQQARRLDELAPVRGLNTWVSPIVQALRDWVMARVVRIGWRESVLREHRWSVSGES